MEKYRRAIQKAADYQIKYIEPVMIGSDVQARLFTPAPGDVIPWHDHREVAREGELANSRRALKKAGTTCDRCTRRRNQSRQA